MALRTAQYQQEDHWPCVGELHSWKIVKKLMKFVKKQLKLFGRKNFLLFLQMSSDRSGKWNSQQKNNERPKNLYAHQWDAIVENVRNVALYENFK
jgi:hypothetical protein